MCIMVQMRREAANFLQTMVIAQAIRDDDSGEATQKAFERYRNTLMPFMKKVIKNEDDKVKAFLEEETKKVLKVSITTNPAHNSKLMAQIYKIKNTPPAGVKDL
jgi:hypothetical protein